MLKATKPPTIHAPDTHRGVNIPIYSKAFIALTQTQFKKEGTEANQPLVVCVDDSLLFDC